jgi:VIT1/CCC1 family predicted Fe2+/Mn2+ transporter
VARAHQIRLGSEAARLGEHHHRDVSGGAARAAVFGVSDGLVSNICVILGVAGGAHYNASFVRLAGLVSMVGGAISMALGEYVSMTAQTELLEAELEMERTELRRRPELERRELAQIYRSRGVDPVLADSLATEMMRDPEMALETHAREELGINPAALGSPPKAAVSSFVSFGVGALVPLLPWFFSGGRGSVMTSLVLGALAAIAVGVALSRFTGRSAVRSALRQLVLSGAAAAASFGIGSLFGVNVA